MAAKQIKTKHPGIYKRGNSYYVRYRVNGTKHGVSVSTLKEALEVKRSREVARDRGEHDLITEGKIPLRDYALEWIGRYSGNGRSGFTENTRAEYLRDLNRYVLPRLGSVKLSALRHRDVADWVAWLCDEKAQGKRVAEEKKAESKVDNSAAPTKPVRLSDATVRRVLCPLRACLATARREGLIRSNPCDDVPLPHRPQIEDEEEKAKAMTRGELAMFLRIVPKAWRLMFKLLATTGVRWSELAAIQWEDLILDGSSPSLRVKRALEKRQPKEGPPRFKPPKSKYGKRTIPLDPDLALELRKNVGDSPTNLVFTASNGRPLRQENVRRRVLAVAAGEAGVPWIGFHTFRHTCASLLFANGRNPKQVQRWLGHHSPSFTLDTYVHLMDDGVGGALSLESNLSPDPAGLGQTEPDSLSEIPAHEAEMPSEQVAA